MSTLLQNSNVSAPLSSENRAVVDAMFDSQFGFPLSPDHAISRFVTELFSTCFKALIIEREGIIADESVADVGKRNVLRENGPFLKYRREADMNGLNLIVMTATVSSLI